MARQTIISSVRRIVAGHALRDVVRRVQPPCVPMCLMTSGACHAARQEAAAFHQAQGLKTDVQRIVRRTRSLKAMALRTEFDSIQRVHLRRIDRFPDPAGMFRGSGMTPPAFDAGTERFPIPRRCRVTRETRAGRLGLLRNAESRSRGRRWPWLMAQSEIELARLIVEADAVFDKRVAAFQNRRLALIPRAKHPFDQRGGSLASAFRHDPNGVAFDCVAEQETTPRLGDRSVGKLPEEAALLNRPRGACMVRLEVQLHFFRVTRRALLLPRNTARERREQYHNSGCAGHPRASAARRLLRHHRKAYRGRRTRSSSGPAVALARLTAASPVIPHPSINSNRVRNTSTGSSCIHLPVKAS